jgi:hypothetical protein
LVILVLIPTTTATTTTIIISHARCLAAAPSFLKARVAKGESLPTPLVVKGMERPWEGVLLEERAKAVAAHVIAPPPLEEGDGEGAGEEKGLPPKAYTMLMAMLVPKFVERQREQERRQRERVGAAAAGAAAVAVGSGEAAATVEDDEGVEESKGKGNWRERRESADVKQAQQWELLRKGGALGNGDGVEDLDAAMAKTTMLNGLGGSGRGRLMRQLKAQSQSQSRRSFFS